MEDFGVQVVNVTPYINNTAVHFKILLKEKDVERDVEFDFNLLEDTEYNVSNDLVQELQFPSQRTNLISDALRNSLKEITQARESAMIKNHIENACRLEKQKHYFDAECMFNLLLDFLETKRKAEPTSHYIDDHEGCILASLGFVQYKLTKYESAKELFKKLLGELNDTEENSNNPHPSKTMMDEDHFISDWKIDKWKVKSLYGMAKIYTKRDKIRKAERYLKKLITLCKDENQYLELARKSYVRILESQGKLYEAELIYKRPFEEKNNTIKQLEEKVEKLIRDECFQEGQMLFKEVLKWKEAVLPLLENLSVLYVKHNKYVEALSCLSRCLEMKEKLRDSEHYSLVETLNKIANIYKLQDKLDVADKTLQKSLKIAEKSLQSNENLLKMYRSMNKQEEVNKSTLRHYEIKKAMILTLDDMKILYDSMPNKKEEAAAAMKKLNEISQNNPPISPSLQSSSSYHSPSPTPPITPQLPHHTKK